MCYKFSLNPLRFSEQFAKLQFLNDEIDQNNIFSQITKWQTANFVQFYKLFTIAQHLALVIFVSVYMRENLRGLRENL